MNGPDPGHIRKRLSLLAACLLAGCLPDGSTGPLMAQVPVVRQAASETVLTPLPVDHASAMFRFPQDETAQDSNRTRLPLVEVDDIDEPLTAKFPYPVIDNQPERPPNQAGKLFADHPESNYPGTFQHRLAVWEAPDIFYNPLYFQDVGLERYGYTHRPFIQPWTSATHFGFSLCTWPLNLLLEKPCSCVTPLGYCRPGSPAPQVHTRWLWWVHGGKHRQ